MEQGMLKNDKQRFDIENKVWLETRKVLGDDAVGNNRLTTGKFQEEIQ